MRPIPTGPIRTFADDRDGAAAVEMALMLPFFITLVLGAVDASNLLLETHRVEQGLELGANYAAKSRDPDAVTAQARNVAVTGQASGGASRVSGWVASDVSISITSLCKNSSGATCTADRFRTGTDSRMVVMSSSHTYRGFGLINAIMRGKLTIRATHEERVTL